MFLAVFKLNYAMLLQSKGLIYFYLRMIELYK